LRLFQDKPGIKNGRNNIAFIDVAARLSLRLNNACRDAAFHYGAMEWKFHERR
jgi:hypothetical protein